MFFQVRGLKRMKKKKQLCGSKSKHASIKCNIFHNRITFRYNHDLGDGESSQTYALCVLSLSNITFLHQPEGDAVAK